MTAWLTHFRTLLGYFSIVAVVLGVHGCDTIEDETTPNKPVVTLQGNKIFALSNSNAFIDLHSMVRTSGEVNIAIGKQPTKGSLKEVSNGFLSYTPGKTFTRGTDQFVVSIFDKHQELLREDTVQIVVKEDTEALPCGIYPQRDSVQLYASTVFFDVLKNDIICGDSANVAVEIYRPDPSFAPYFGSATVENHRIIYTAGEFYSGTDLVVYKVYSKIDNTIFGFGTLSIIPPFYCELNLEQDLFEFGADTLANTDTLRLFVLGNDRLCPDVDYTMSFDMGPAVGEASWKDERYIRYVIKSPMDGYIFTDSLRYKVCDGGECETGYVHITID